MNDRQLTFSELSRKSKALASAIRGKHVTNCPIAIYAERSVDTPVLILAVLYSGNYYIPVNPDMPDCKIREILESAKCPVLLARERASVKSAEFLHSENLMTMESILSTDGSDAFEVESGDGSAPLYVIYTSGSTGTPKGILKNHAAVISFMEAYCATFDFSERDNIGNQTPFFFDASAKDFYLMLKTGATLDLIPQELFISPIKLISYLNEHAVTFISWVPSALVILTKLNAFASAKPTTLEKVFFVGEVMPVKHLKQWMAALPAVKFVNLYGSSEIAGIACYHEIAGDFSGDDELPIGKPLSNCRVFLRAEGRVLTRAGETGEIWIASEALAREYYHDPERTAACFQMLQIDGAGQVRCLKTGDLAQYNENGDLVFVARNDFQVKHMGYRIELGEIETAAEKIPDVQRARCVYDKVKERIYLFCERKEGSALDRIGIMKALNPRLPFYMMPNKIKIIPSFPLNSNGKVDLQQLKELASR